MFVIPFETINTEMKKNHWSAHYNRYYNCVTDARNGKKLTHADIEFIREFEEYMNSTLDLMHSQPDVLSDYYFVRKILTDASYSPETLDCGVFCNAYAKKDLPEVYDEIDADALETCGYIPSITKIVSNKPDTAVYFNDGSHVTVHCEKNEPFDTEKGIYLAILKKAIGAKNLRSLFAVIEAAEAEERLVEQAKAEKAARKAEALRPKAVMPVPPKSITPVPPTPDTESKIVSEAISETELEMNDAQTFDTENTTEKQTPSNDSDAE